MEGSFFKIDSSIKTTYTLKNKAINRRGDYGEGREEKCLLIWRAEGGTRQCHARVSNRVSTLFQVSFSEHSRCVFIFVLHVQQSQNKDEKVFFRDRKVLFKD